MKVVHTSFVKRIFQSFIGLVIGVLLFLGSFGVLFVNEGRENLANYAKAAKEYDANKTYTEDELVYIIGSLEATTYAADSFLKAGNYIYIERQVEMYGYTEREKRETKENLGGSSDTIITYSYELGWIKDPQPATTFKGDANELPNNLPSEYNNWINQMPNQASDRGSGFSVSGVSVSESDLVLSNAHQITLTNDAVNSEALSSDEQVTNDLS